MVNGATERLEEKLDWVDIHHPLIRNQAYN
jgi:hypothetical protein